MRLDAKMLDFGTPLAPSWAQNGARNRPAAAKMLQKLVQNFSGVKRTSGKQKMIPFGRYLVAPSHHFDGIGMDF